MTKYACGHTPDMLILDNSPLAITAWVVWKDTVGFNGDKSQCFHCYCKELRGDKDNGKHMAR
jgi:hypothetical protein